MYPGKNRFELTTRLPPRLRVCYGEPSADARCARTLACGVHMAFVTLRDGESPEGIVSRFRAAVTRNGILKEHKDRRFFRSKGEKARLAARRSARRRRRAGG